MKKFTAIAVLMLTGLSAFAAPISRQAVAASNFHKTVVVAHKNGRKTHRRMVKKVVLRSRRSR